MWPDWVTTRDLLVFGIGALLGFNVCALLHIWIMDASTTRRKERAQHVWDSPYSLTVDRRPR